MAHRIEEADAEKIQSHLKRGVTMNRTGQNLIKKLTWMVSAIFLLIPAGYIGCSLAGDQVLPAHLESRISSHATADDHLAAALLYQQEAQVAKTEADKYEQAAASIKPIEDPKGFRRSALMTAAQEQRGRAHEMQQLYATHEAKAQTMLGQQQPQ
jgi:hypothetical protein